MYKPTDANCIQIIRGGRTYSVANTGTYYIVKNGEQNAYMVTNVGSASKKSSDVLGTSAFYEFAMALQRKSRNAVKFYRIDEECECQGNWEKRIS